MSQETVKEEIPEEDEFDDSEIELDDDAIEAELLAIDDDDDDGGPPDDDEDGDDDDEGDGEEALDELEAEELDMLTDDETSETLAVDEAAEMRQIRREELAMDRKSADEASEDEFVCVRCYLVLKTSQLADGRRKICQDCAA